MALKAVKKKKIHANMPNQNMPLKKKKSNMTSKHFNGSLKKIYCKLIYNFFLLHKYIYRSFFFRILLKTYLLFY